MFRRIVIALSASSLLLGGVAQTANAATGDGALLTLTVTAFSN
ncbi:unannotated protein [freshwater metagenome]|uniref:Unannotated protein n=1 Tax=freshwater metagenome TaxID=449393 RepID=A0A6J5Z9G9_9ZZZZ